MEDANGNGEINSNQCGDLIKIHLKIRDGIIEKASFETYGSPAAIASSSIATEIIQGETVQTARALDARAIVQSLHGLPPERMRSAVLAAKAVRLALDDYQEKKHAKFLDSTQPGTERDA